MPPYDQVMRKWKAGTLHSGSKTGPKVTKQKQAIGIMLSEKRAAAQGKSEYKPSRTRRYNATGDGLSRKRQMYG